MNENQFVINFTNTLKRIIEIIDRRLRDSVALTHRVYFLEKPVAHARLVEVVEEFSYALKFREITLVALITYATRIATLSAQFGAQLKTDDKD